MATKLGRVFQAIFGSSGPVSQFEAFGSDAAGSAVKTQNIASIMSTAAWLQGWYAATESANQPPRIEDFNAIDLLITTQLAYIFQEGMPEYDPTTPYFSGSFCQVAGAVYVSQSNNNIGNNPTTDPGTNWLKSLGGVNPGAGWIDQLTAAFSGFVAPNATNATNAANAANAAKLGGVTPGTGWLAALAAAANNGTANGIDAATVATLGLGTSTPVSATSDWNNYLLGGIFVDGTGAIGHAPWNAVSTIVFVIPCNSINTVQIAFQENALNGVAIRFNNAGTWTPWIPYQGDYILNLLNASGSPFSLAAFSAKIISAQTTVNPFVINLPKVSTCLGWDPTFLAIYGLPTGLVKLVPYPGDYIGPLPVNTPVYLQSVDASGAPFYFSSLKLLAADSTHWSVMAGQFMPDQSVDPPGSQYHLGKLRHLPSNSSQTRALLGINIPATNTFSAAIQATGTKGIPAGAKAIRALVRVFCNCQGSTAAADLVIQLGDNNTAANYGSGLAVATIEIGGPPNGPGASLIATTEVDIALNSLGQFYVYTTLANSWVNVAGSTIQVVAMGYYMGD